MAAALYEFFLNVNYGFPDEFQKAITKKHIEIFGGNGSTVFFKYTDAEAYVTFDTNGQEKIQVDALRIHVPSNTEVDESEFAALVEGVEQVWRKRMQEIKEMESWGGENSRDNAEEKVDWDAKTLGPIFILKDLVWFKG